MIPGIALAILAAGIALIRAAVTSGSIAGAIVFGGSGALLVLFSFVMFAFAYLVAIE